MIIDNIVLFILIISTNIYRYRRTDFSPCGLYWFPPLNTFVPIVLFLQWD